MSKSIRNSMDSLDFLLSELNSRNVVTKIFRKVGKQKVGKYIRSQCKEGVAWRKNGESFMYNPKEVSEFFKGKLFIRELSNCEKMLLQQSQTSDIEKTEPANTSSIEVNNVKLAEIQKFINENINDADNKKFRIIIEFDK